MKEEYNIRGDGYITKDSGKRKEFKDGMVRDTAEDKTRYDLIWTPMLTRWANLMTRGAKKYGERNWEKANTEEAYNRFRESAFRHFMQWFDNVNDEDHCAAVIFNLSGAEYVKEKLHGKNK